MPNTDREWRKWGRLDPYFGVLAHSDFSRENIAENRDAFFLTGELYVSAVLRDLDKLTVRPQRGRALDYGCGTGRLTIALSRAYEHVAAVDVAPEMLAEAEQNAREAGCRNIEFNVADDLLTRVPGSFDLVLSHLVLQHVPVKRGEAIFRQLLDRVSPGGAFHVSVSIRNDVGFLRALYWASAHVPFVKGVQNLLRGDRWSAPAMQMNDYSLGRLLSELSKRNVQRFNVSIDPFHARFQTVCLSGVVPV